MDAVRGIDFLDSINSMVTASEDCTVKVWDTTKFQSLKEIEDNMGTNFEPYITLRGHLSPILSMSVCNGP
jgi:WD40 repeat protein